MTDAVSVSWFMLNTGTALHFRTGFFRKILTGTSHSFDLTGAVEVWCPELQLCAKCPTLQNAIENAGLLRNPTFKFVFYLWDWIRFVLPAYQKFSAYFLTHLVCTVRVFAQTYCFGFKLLNNLWENGKYIGTPLPSYFCMCRVSFTFIASLPDSDSVYPSGERGSIFNTLSIQLESQYIVGFWRRVPSSLWRHQWNRGGFWGDCGTLWLSLNNTSWAILASP